MNINFRMLLKIVIYVIMYYIYQLLKKILM